MLKCEVKNVSYNGKDKHSVMDLLQENEVVRQHIVPGVKLDSLIQEGDQVYITVNLERVGKNRIESKGDVLLSGTQVGRGMRQIYRVAAANNNQESHLDNTQMGEISKAIRILEQNMETAYQKLALLDEKADAAMSTKQKNAWSKRLKDLEEEPAETKAVEEAETNEEKVQPELDAPPSIQEPLQNAA